MLFSTLPTHIAAYSQRTKDKEPTMKNVWSIPKKEKCVDCGKHRTAITGKQMKRGFVCHGCAK